MKILVSNKKALFNYEIIHKYECGISLLGSEVKSIINSKANIDNAFIIFRSNQCYIINMYITPLTQGNLTANDANRTRKLLLHKNEILKIQNYVKKNNVTIIPLDIHLSKNKIKLLISIAKHKNQHDKREIKKRRDNQREIKRFL